MAPYRTLLHAHKVWEDWGGCYLQWWLSTNTPSLLLTRPRTTYTEWAVTMASQCVTVGTKSMEKCRLGGGCNVHELQGGPTRGHDNGNGDEIPIGLSGHLEISIGIDTNIDRGEGRALHLQDLLHVLGDSVT